MQITNRAFISRPYINIQDTYKDTKELLERLPAIITIQTSYIPATDTEGAFIAACWQETKASIQVPFAYEHNRIGTHYVAARALMIEEHPSIWESFVVLGATPNNWGYLFCFGVDGLEN